LPTALGGIGVGVGVGVGLLLGPGVAVGVGVGWPGMIRGEIWHPLIAATTAITMMVKKTKLFRRTIPPYRLFLGLRHNNPLLCCFC
jgi:hypothetical protein